MGVDNMGKIGFMREEENKNNDNSKKDGLRLKKIEVEFIGREKEIIPKSIEILEEEINNIEVKKPKKNRINKKIVSILVENGIEEKYAKEISRSKEESDRFLKLIENKNGTVSIVGL